MTYLGNPSTTVSPIIFPETLIPNWVRNLTLPNYKVIVSENEDGSEIRRYVYSSGHGTKIQFDYEAQNESQTALAIRFYNHCKGTYAPFHIPLSIIRHSSQFTDAIATLGDTSLWRFESEPSISVDYVGIYNFSFQLTSMGNNLTVPDGTGDEFSPFPG